jgi:hypothetical protein
MKKITLFLTAFILMSVYSFAQVQEGDIKFFQQLFGTEKIALVKEFMDLTPQQDSVFWKDYDAYETARLELGKRRILLIDEYGKNYTKLTDAKATELINEANAIDVEFKKLQKTFYKKMTKSIGAMKAAQFYQFESYLNNAINITIQENIPFVGELDKIRKR